MKEAFFNIGRLQTLLLAFFIVNPSCGAENLIQWATPDSPPMHINSGPDSGKGFADLSQAYLIRHLTDYQHARWHVDTPRAFFEMRQHDGICYFPVLKTPERETVVLFSHRAMNLPGYRVIVSQDKRKQFDSYLNNSDRVDLEKLRESETLKGGYVLAQPYEGPIASLLNDTKKPLKLTAVPHLSQLQKMLRAGFIDFYLYYPFFAPEGISEDGFLLPFLGLAIEGSPEKVKAYVACSRGPLGQAVITRIDGLLSNNSNWAEFLSPLRSWLSPRDFAAAGSDGSMP